MSRSYDTLRLRFDALGIAHLTLSRPAAHDCMSADASEEFSRRNVNATIAEANARVREIMRAAEGTATTGARLRLARLTPHGDR